MTKLFDDLALAHGDGSIGRRLKSLAAPDLLILDDWGFQVLSQAQRIDLLEILEDRTGRGSTLVTSQVPIDQWCDIIGDPILADAILDRFVHNAHHPSNAQTASSTALLPAATAKAQINPGRSLSLDEKRGSGQRPRLV